MRDGSEYFWMAACQAAIYVWRKMVDALLEYLQGNIEFMKRFFEENMPMVK
ncbi:hypothetical protein [Dubosiella newyorkensis]|uniref:hypothetical protein n=1 Tax=Dubosiella newyorkensis TaxID=1862672 RepID=UPI003F6678C0